MLSLVPWGRIPSFAQGGLLAVATDMLRLSVALGAFIVPGVLLLLVLAPVYGTADDPIGVIPQAFSVSVFLMSAIGLAGRLVGVPFLAIQVVYTLVGLVELVLLFCRPGGMVHRGLGARELLESVFSNAPLATALLLSTSLMFMAPLFFIDDTSYLAYLTNWQHSTSLNFRTIVYDLNQLESPRFWLAMYPMTQAWLANTSGVPGLLLLGSYLEFLLVPVAVLASYGFGRELGLSRRASGFAALMQVTIYAWMIAEPWPVGMWFYQNMAEDKVTAVFILGPVLLGFGLRYLRRPNGRSFILVLLGAFSLALTHPVSQFYVIMVLLILSVLGWLVHRVSWRQILATSLACVLSLVPSAAIRFSERAAAIGIPFDGASASRSFQISRYTRVVGPIFYGLNPDVLRLMDLPLEGEAHSVYEVIRWLPAAIAGAAAILSMFQLSRGPLQWYVLSCAVLVLVAALPFTGWLLGYFVSARLISRASWLLPLGTGGVLIMISLRRVASRYPGWQVCKATWIANGRFADMAGIATLVLLASPIVVFASLRHVPEYFERLEHDKQLAAVGEQIDRATKGPVTALGLDYAENQILPGVSANVRLISFREEVERDPHNYTLPPEEIRNRRRVSKAIRFGTQINAENPTCSAIRAYSLTFVLAHREASASFMRWLEGCGLRSRIMFATRDLALVELR